MPVFVIRESGRHASSQKPLSSSCEASDLLPASLPPTAQGLLRHSLQGLTAKDNPLLRVHLPEGLLTSAGIAIMLLGRRKWNVAMLGRKRDTSQSPGRLLGQERCWQSWC